MFVAKSSQCKDSAFHGDNKTFHRLFTMKGEDNLKVGTYLLFSSLGHTH